MLFNSIFGRKNSTSSTTSKGVKLNKNNHQPRRMVVEPLESRDLLTVTTEAIDDATYDEIRAAYPEFNLPELQADLNVMGASSLADLKDAIEIAGTTTQSDLVVIRTSGTSNTAKTFTYWSNSDVVTIDIDSTQYGSVTIIGWGEDNLTLDANENSRVMSVFGSTVNLGGLTITGGASYYAGGGICNSGTLTIINCSISDNYTSDEGGGIYNSGTLTIINSSISNNFAADEGGGISNSAPTNGTATLTIINSTISGNNADDNASAIYNSPGYSYEPAILTITNCIISGNKHSNSYTGVIYNQYGGTLTVTGSAIVGNYSRGIYNENGTLTVTNSTISGNTSGRTYSYSYLEGGGGIYSSGAFTVNNSIISRNFNGNISGFGDLSSNSSNNLIGGYYPGFICPPQCEREAISNSDTVDMHLRSDSIAIDSGRNAAVRDLESDIDGNTRIYGNIVDLGAYEYQGDRTDEPIPYSTVVNTLNDSFDLNDDEWSLREAIYFAPEYVTITFAEGLEGTIVLSLGQIDLEAPLAIDGDNRITIDANQKGPVFYVSAGTEENPVVLKGLTIQNGNNSVSSGGAIYSYFGFLTIANCVFSNNTTARQNGGGIFNYYGTLNVYNSVFWGNSANDAGGGIYNCFGILTVANSTISGNSAKSSQGGGIYNNSGTVTLTDSIVTRNYSGNIHGGFSTNSSNNLIGYYSSFVSEPEFDVNGNLTNADTIDLHLRSDSIAIDNGDNARVADTQTDVEGNVRIFGETVDLGAYEYQGDRNDEPIPYLSVVNTLNDSFDLNDDEWSLREAIYYAPKYVTIRFANDLEGTIDLTLGQLQIEAPLAINGNNRISIESDYKSRIFYISTGIEDSSVVLEDLTIQNGSGPTNPNYYGPAIYNYYGYLNVINCLITRNEGYGIYNDYGTLTISDSEISHNGGGIYNDYGTLSISNSKISNNSNRGFYNVGIGISNSYGTLWIYGSEISNNADGGISSFSGTATVTNSEVLDNSSGGISTTYGSLTVINSTISGNVSTSSGGGISSYAGTTTIKNSTISRNIAYNNGGGIYNDFGTLTITDSTILRNTAYQNGGGIYKQKGTLTVTNSAISRNTAIDEAGGGIYNQNGTFTITNSTVLRNIADFGGGIYNWAPLTATNCTIAGNTASSSGGGVFIYDGRATLYNTIVAANIAENDNDLYRNNGTIIGYNSLSSYTAWGGSDNFEYDHRSPLFNDVDKYDYSLAPESQAIDKGNNQYALDAEISLSSIDMAGASRFVGDAIDLGAYEYYDYGNYEPMYYTVVTTLNDSFDLNDNEWSLREAVYYATESITITFADELEGSIVLTKGQLEINRPLAIDGDNRITINAAQMSRAFYITAGTEEIPVVLNGLKIQNGYAVNGGGIYNDHGTLAITNSEISGNTASNRGGGIDNSGTLTITNSTISGNDVSDADSYGGGIFNNGSLNVYNAIVAANAAQNGSDIDSEGESNGYNSLSTYTAWGGSDNIEFDPNSPLFVDAANGNYRLAEGSQAIDMGNKQYANNAGLDRASTDLDGSARFVGEAIDLGAYEYHEGETAVYVVVNTLNDSFNPNDDELSLREAIYYASEYVTIVFADELEGSVVLTQGQLEIDKALAIDGENRITIDADQKSRVFDISAGTDVKPVVLNGLTILNGKASSGGGIINSGVLTVTNCSILENSAHYGGGVYNLGYGVITVTDCIISDNAASYGGGLYNYGVSSGKATFTLTQSTISENEASYGGGIYNYNQVKITKFIVTDCTISDNTVSQIDSTALQTGGGIYNKAEYNGNAGLMVTDSVISNNNKVGIYNADYGTLSATHCTISDNTGCGISNSGTLTVTDSAISNNTVGGISNSGTLTVTDSAISNNTVGGISNSGTLTVTDSTISCNKASYGGGIYNSRTLTVTNSAISGNEASYDGGGISNSGTLTVTDSTISCNKASYGGGICNYAGTITVIGSTISDNSASGGGGGINSEVFSNEATSVTLINSVISDNTARYGGGVYNRSYSSGSSLLTITNCSISGNTASNYGGIYTNGVTTVANSIVSINYSGNIYGGLTEDSYNNLINVANPGFVCNPRFDSSGNLINADEIDLHLRSDSIAIDKGDNSLVGDIESDIDGHIRIYGDTVDIGAYEYQGDRNDEPMEDYTVVTTLNDSFDPDDNEWSLREAINYASEYVTITFADELEGSIVLTQGQLEISTPLVINGDNRITIDADQKSRVFYISAGTEENPVVLNGLTIQNGNDDYGGGISLSSGYLSISNSEISRNTVSGGGGGIANSGNLTVSNSMISENSASGNGGGISNSGNLTISNSKISENSATNGGAISNYQSTLSITNSEISGNSASDRGGGFYNYTMASYGATSAKLIITNCNISGNSAESGGGVYNFSFNPRDGVSTDITIINSAITGNNASSSGGGISTISMYKKCNVNLTVYNSTISGNNASQNGGGVYLSSEDFYDSRSFFYNSIVACNTSSNGCDIYENDTSEDYWNNYDIYICNSLSSITEWYEDSVIEYDPNSPLFVDAANGDYRLAEGSQAIDKGNNQYAIDAGLDESSTDLAGKSRFVGDAIDIGAYEYLALEALAVPTLNTPTANGQTISVSWNSIPNADGYILEYQLSTDSAWTTVFVSGTSATFIGDPGMTYNIRVKAKGSGNYSNSDYSAVKSVYVNNEQVTDDASCLRAFLELTDEDGVKNGEKINSAYDANDTSTWTGVTWSEIDGVMRVTAIDWCDMQLVGELDLSQCSALEELYCISNLLTAINVSGCTALTSLWCGDNLLTALDVSNNPALDYLNCCINQISSLDVTKNAVLGFLDCGDNQLTSLNVSSNLFLWQLNCDCNQLTSLDVSNNTYLSQLRCHVNQLTALDVSNNPELWHLDCRYNNLTQLDLSNNSQLMEFYCNSNNLTSLDVSNNPELKWFGCSNNQLTSLDVSNNSELASLACWNSGLKSVIINPSTENVSISLDSERWTFLDANDNALADSASSFVFSASDSAALPITAVNSYDDQTILFTDVIPVDILTVQNDFVKTTLNNPVVIDYRENDTVTDWSATTVYFGDASFGEYAVNADGTITYTPEDRFYGTDAVSYVVVGSSGELATGAIVISVGLPIATSVQTTSGSHSPTSAMAPSVPAVTDWDDCYVELWAQGVNELNPGETTLTLEYNPAVYGAPAFSACADGVALTVSQSSVLPNGNVLVELTAQVSEPLASQTDNLFLGTVVLTPSMDEDSGVEGSAVPVIALDGSETPTTVESMQYDLIRNGAVDVNDFVAFATVYGNAPESLSPDNPLYAQTAKADFNNDGIVNVADFILFATNYGATKKTADNPTAQGALQVKSEYIAEEIVNEEFVIQIADPDNSVQETSNSQLITLNSQPEVESSMTLLQAYSSALLDLYDNQNEQLQPSSELSAPAIDAALYQDDEFDFLFDETDSDSSDSSDVDLSVFLDELELELI